MDPARQTLHSGVKRPLGSLRGFGPWVRSEWQFGTTEPKGQNWTTGELGAVPEILARESLEGVSAVLRHGKMSSDSMAAGIGKKWPLGTSRGDMTL